MSANENNQNINTTVSVPVYNIQYTSSFRLPLAKKWKKYFLNVCENVQRCSYVLNAHLLDTGHLYVVTNNSDAMACVKFIVDRKIETFINRKQALTNPSKAKKLRKNNKSTSSHVRTTDELKTNISNILRRILQRKKGCLTKYSRSTTVSKKKRVGCKKWHELDKKSKTPKAILKHERQEIKYRRRHHLVSLYRQKKRSAFEYRQKKVIGRRRDRMKTRNASKAKRKFIPNRDKRKVSHLYKHTTTYGSHTKPENISVTKSGKNVKSQTKFPRSSYFDFSEATIMAARSLTYDNEKILLHYSNQRVFIYALPINHSNRPSKKYLINTFSTIDYIQSTSFDESQSLSSSTRQTTTLMNPGNYDMNTSQSGKRKTRKFKGKPTKKC